LAKGGTELDEPLSSRLFDLTSVLSNLGVAQTARPSSFTSSVITTTTSTSTEVTTTTTTATSTEFPLTPGTSIDQPTLVPLVSDIPSESDTSFAGSGSITSISLEGSALPDGSPTTPGLAIPMPPPTSTADSFEAPSNEIGPATSNAGNEGDAGPMTSYTGWLPITSFSPNMDFQSISDAMSQSLGGLSSDSFTSSSIDVLIDPMTSSTISPDLMLPTLSIPLPGTDLDLHTRPTPQIDNSLTTVDPNIGQSADMSSPDIMTNEDPIMDSVEKHRTTKYVFMTVPIDSLAVPQQTKYATLTEIQTQVQIQTEVSTQFRTRIRTSILLSTKTVSHTPRPQPILEPEPEPEVAGDDTNGSNYDPAGYVKPIKTGRPHRKPARPIPKPYKADESYSINMSDANIQLFNKALRSPCFQKCATSSCPLQEEFYFTCVCTQYTKRILACAQDQCDGGSYRRGVPRLVKACGNLFVDTDDDDE